jgi:hypothetical protein
VIRHIKHSGIDREKWDACVIHSDAAVIYAASWWLDIVSPGWDGLVLDDYSAVMPLTKKRKFGFHYLFQPPFTQQGGIFSASENLTEKFIHAIPKQFRLVEIQLNVCNTLSESTTIKVVPKKTHHLLLQKEISVLRKIYSENTRRNLKKFEKGVFQHETSDTADDIITLFRNNKGMSVDNLKEKEYEILKKLVEEAARRGLISIQQVRNEDGNIIAGAIFIHSYRSYIFLFSAVNQEAKNSGAMAGIIDHFIYTHSGEKKYLDFEGSIIPELARFYKSFGSEEIVYLQIRRNTLPPVIRRLK